MCVGEQAARCTKHLHICLLRRPSHLVYTCDVGTTQMSMLAAWHQTCHANLRLPPMRKMQLGMFFLASLCNVVLQVSHKSDEHPVASWSQLTTSLLCDTPFAVNGAGWGTESAGAWGPTAYLEPPAAPRHFTNTEQPYVEHVTTTAVPQGSETTG